MKFAPRHRQTRFVSIAIAMVITATLPAQTPARVHPSAMLRKLLPGSSLFGKREANPVRTQPNTAASPTRSTRWPFRIESPSTSAAPFAVTQTQYLSPGVISTPIASPVPAAVVPATGYAVSQPCADGACSCGSCAGACVAPLGATIQNFFDMHVYQGEKARLLLNHYDFYSGPAEDPSRLNSAGLRKIASLKRLLAESGHPLMIQRVDRNVGLSQTRQAHVQDVLQSEFGLHGTQVVIGDFDSAGLRGPEAIEIDRSQQQITRALGDSQPRTRSTSATNISSGQRNQGR